VVENYALVAKFTLLDWWGVFAAIVIPIDAPNPEVASCVWDKRSKAGQIRV
jgi:hypothetical protein